MQHAAEVSRDWPEGSILPAARKAGNAYVLQRKAGTP